MFLKSRYVAWGLAVGLLAGACTATASEGGSGSDDASVEVAADGVADDSITVSLVYADLSQLTEQNLAPEIGDAGKTTQAVVDDINASGGINGRQIILKPHVLTGAAGLVNPEVGRQACLEATEDDKPLAVIVAASLPQSMVECVGVDHDPIAITMDSWPASLYDTMQGRLFSVASHNSIQQDRAYAAWPRAIDSQYPLEGKKVGIISADTAEQRAGVDDLKPSLEEAGADLVAEAVLPCPEGSQTCEQHDVAIQRMRDAGVEVVFLMAQTLTGSATVEAAAKVGYKPQWATVGQNVKDTTAKFYKNASDTFDGALGLGVRLNDFTTEADDCNRLVVAAGGKQFAENEDGYGYTATTCLQMRTLADALALIDGTITQDAVIGALESLSSPPMAENPAGSLSADKHDAGTVLYLGRYSAAEGRYLPVSTTPIEID